MADSDVQADGYYASDDMESKDIDLSFLDEHSDDEDEVEEGK
ncbi:MAG TPA: hypothetical protein VLG16_02700 [Candidatus Saccharimonadales bacterium]|nr:hypothetical protein [Candidatus Saccharimonadales bacterium]